MSPFPKDFHLFLRIALFLNSKVCHFHFQALPFGLSSAPMIFTKTMAVVTVFFHKEWILIVLYLDDFLIVGDSVTQVSRHLKLVLELFFSLEWLINFKKLDLIPNQSKTFLGILLNSTFQTSLLSERKQENIFRVSFLISAEIFKSFFYPVGTVSRAL